MQGQFSCPECGQPILIMIHRKGDVARCLSCGAKVEVPHKLETASQNPEELSDSAGPGIEMNNVLAKIAANLQRYARLVTIQDSASIEVQPAADGGFRVRISMEHDECVVEFGNCHFPLEDPNEAFYWFGMGLTDRCRLRVIRRGDFEYKWTIEFADQGDWHCVGTTALFFCPFWRRRHEFLLQNHLISGPSSGSWIEWDPAI